VPIAVKIRLDQFENADFDRGSRRLKELAWWLSRCIFFDHRFPVPSAVKIAVLRIFGANVGRGVVIRSRVNIVFPWRLRIGNHVWIGDDVLILNLDQVTIGSNVCLSQQAFLCTGGHDYKKQGFDLITAPIVIRDHCWIGAAVFVAPGITVGEESVCAAGSVVVKDVPAGMVVAGNPAKVIKATTT